MLTKLMQTFTKGAVAGAGFGLALITTAVFAVTVSGTIKTWSSGETLTSTDLNTTITSLKTAVEGIPDWAKSGAHAVFNGGNVGIGKVPASPLDVNGAIAGTSFTGSASGLTDSLVRVTDGVVSSDVTDIDLTGLNINTHGGWYMLAFTVNYSSGAGSQIKLYVEGDTTDTNYYSQCLLVDGTTVTAARVNRPEFSFIGGTTYYSEGVMYIKRDPSGRIRINSNANEAQFTGGSNVRMNNCAIASANAYTNVTSIRIASSASFLKSGSKFTIYRMR